MIRAAVVVLSLKLLMLSVRRAAALWNWQSSGKIHSASILAERMHFPMDVDIEVDSETPSTFRGAQAALDSDVKNL